MMLILVPMIILSAVAICGCSDKNSNNANNLQPVKTGENLNRDGQEGQSLQGTDSDIQNTETGGATPEGGDDSAKIADDNNAGTQGVQNTYVAMDYDFSSEILGHSGCVFMVPLLQGDTVQVNATTENPVDFISGDSNFYISFVTNSGKYDASRDITLYPTESLQNTNSYHFTGPIDRNNFNLVVRNPDGTYDNIKGHMKIVVHSKFPKSEYDTKPTSEGVLAAKDSIKYAYVLQDWDFNSEKYGAINCLSMVYLLPGDIVAASVTTEKPVDFISGDYGFGVDFMTNDGKIKSENVNQYTIYQSESSSNAKTYNLFKQINRKWFVLVARNPTGDFKNLKGHKKITVFSQYSPQEHNDAFTNDYVKVMGYNPDFSQLPYNVADTSDPDNTWHDAWALWQVKRAIWQGNH